MPVAVLMGVVVRVVVAGIRALRAVLVFVFCLVPMLALVLVLGRPLMLVLAVVVAVLVAARTCCSGPAVKLTCSTSCLCSPSCWCSSGPPWLCPWWLSGSWLHAYAG